MAVFNWIARKLIKYHPFILFPWIISEYMVGSVLHYGDVRIFGVHLYDVPKGTEQQRADLEAAHRASGAILAALAAILLLVKLYVVLTKLPRAKSSSAFAAFVVQVHFLGIAPVLIFQWASKEYTSSVASLFGVTESTVWAWHGVVAQVAVAYALWLAAIAAFIAFIKPAVGKKSPATQKKKN